MLLAMDGLYAKQSLLFRSDREDFIMLPDLGIHPGDHLWPMRLRGVSEREAKLP